MRLVLLPVTFLLCAAAQAQLAPNAPKDQPQPLQEAQLIAFDRAIAPHVAKARETYPVAKSRYLAGLPRGETFFVTTRLKDKDGRWEQVFIRVSRIDGARISGAIANDLHTVVGFRPGQSYSFEEAELLDWLISKPDGSEEGNVVGKFLDTYRP